MIYILIIIKMNMGNSESKSPTTISNNLYTCIYELLDNYNTFIQNDEPFRRTNNNVNGGISTGVSSSDRFTNNSDVIKIWYDINFIKILRGRNKLLSEWVQKFNKMKNNTQFKISENSAFTFRDEKVKAEYMKSHEVVKNNMTLNDIQELTKIPKNVSFSNRGNQIYKQFKKLVASHGFKGNKDIISSFVNLMNLPEGRCTSGLDTFLDSLSPRLQKIINECESDKDFYVKISLRYENHEHKKKYELAINDIEKITKEYILIPIQLKIDEYMNEGNVILVEYKWINTDLPLNLPEEDLLDKSTFEWKIPDGFFSKYYLHVGDTFEFPQEEIPFETSLKIEGLWRKEFYKRTKDIKSPPVIKKTYSFSLNIDDSEKFNTFIVESCNDFINYKNEMISIGALEHYEL